MNEYQVRLKKPHPHQLAILQSTAKRKIIRAGRRAGKTTAVAIIAVEWFLRGRRVLYAAPTTEQLNQFWKEVKTYLADLIDAGIFLKNETEHTIERPGTSQSIRAKTAWNADTLRGDYADLLILDEWQIMDETAWDDVGAPMLLDNNGDAIFVYTPPSLRSQALSKARDPRHASRKYKEALAEQQAAAAEDKPSRWQAFHFRSQDNPHISQDALREISKDMSNLSYRQEILAEDVEDTPGALWTRVLIESARIHDVPQLIRVAVGVDPPGGAGECGIVVAGVGLCMCNGTKERHAFVLSDRSLKAVPDKWAKEVVAAPLVSVPQRGGRTYVAKMVYDSRIYKIVDTGDSQSWQPTNLPYPSVGGWRLVTTSGLSTAFDVVYHTCYYEGNPQSWFEYKNYRLYDIDGTVRKFPLYSGFGNSCYTATGNTSSNSDLDATGFLMTTGYVRGPDGTLSTPSWADPNGNFMDWDANGNVVDTLNRTVVQTTYPVACDQYTDFGQMHLTVLTSTGSSTYKLYFKCDTLYLPMGYIQTGFGGATEYTGENAGWLYRIELPDGTDYEFNYDTGSSWGACCYYGFLTSMTVPTGETVSFNHTNFTDAQGNTYRWLTSFTAGGGTRTFSFGSCGANCLKRTVTQPSGNETEYQFTLNNGAWLTQRKSYTGSVASGTLLLTVNNDYDFTLPNPESGGAGFIRPIRTTTTWPGPAGNLVKKTEATYDTFTYTYRGTVYTGSRGNVLTHKEYAYGSGVAGGLLREQVFTYLHDANASYIR